MDYFLHPDVFPNNMMCNMIKWKYTKYAVFRDRNVVRKMDLTAKAVALNFLRHIPYDLYSLNGYQFGE